MGTTRKPQRSQALDKTLLVTEVHGKKPKPHKHRHREPELKSDSHRRHTAHATQQAANPVLGGRILSLRNRCIGAALQVLQSVNNMLILTPVAPAKCVLSEFPKPPFIARGTEKCANRENQTRLQKQTWHSLHQLVTVVAGTLINKGITVKGNELYCKSLRIIA